MELQFKIDDKEWSVPEYIDVKTFERAIVWDLEDLNNLKPFVASIIGCPIAHLNRLDEEVLAFITGVCLQRIQIQESKLCNKIGLCPLKDFETYTFGNFIDLDMLLSQSAGQNLSKLAALLYDTDEITASGWDVRDVWGAVREAAVWRQWIYTQYEEFFELSDKTSDEEVEPQEANVSLMWYNAIIALADEDFLKIHQVVERPYKEALNYLTWKKAKAQREKLETLKRKNDLQRRIR